MTNPKEPFNVVEAPDRGSLFWRVVEGDSRGNRGIWSYFDNLKYAQHQCDTLNEICRSVYEAGYICGTQHQLGKVDR